MRFPFINCQVESYHRLRALNMREIQVEECRNEGAGRMSVCFTSTKRFKMRGMTDPTFSVLNKMRAIKQSAKTNCNTSAYFMCPITPQ